ncbi:MAG TPA: LacI family DNA-binding transcriptional regulator, partial [Anaerolineaceae bacterium]|nr:LacI family DNA-binding transcriptional regulator [Anaerolineaceae bacterium]
VVEAAREMGYFPSRAARQLRKRQAEAIGIVVPTLTPGLADPTFLEFVAGLGDEATAHHYDLLVSTAPPESEAEKDLYTRWVHSRRVDGIVLGRARAQDWRIETLTAEGLPFVAYGKGPPGSAFPYVEVDSRTGMQRLVAHLVSLGHRRIAYIGAPERFGFQAERLAGYREGLAAAGLPPRPDYVAGGDLTQAGGRRAALHLLALPEPPTAILGATDLTAIGAIHAAHERGLTVGRDLAVTGFDGTTYAETMQPALTTLDQPLYAIARRLVALLLASLGRIPGEPAGQMQVTLTPEVIVRASSAGHVPNHFTPRDSYGMDH